MGYWEVCLKQQTWNDFVTAQDQIKGFDKALQKQTRSLTGKIGLAERDYQVAIASGFGAISDRIGELGNTIEFGFDDLANGIDKLNADFNLLMGDVIWKLEVQNDTLASILRTLQAPLDTQAKELRHRAEDAYQNGWYEEALADFLESERKNYQDFAVHRSIGNIYLYHLVDLPKALNYFRKAAKYARPRDTRQAAEAEYFVGVVCGIQDEPKQALTHMQEAARLNTVFCDAWYMAAGFAGILGDPHEVTENLEVAIAGDARYHERVKAEPTFRKGAVNQQVQILLERFLESAKEKAANAKRQIDGMRDRCNKLLPPDQQHVLKLFTAAEEYLSEARTYQQYLVFSAMPSEIESDLRAAERRWMEKQEADRSRVEHERAERERKEQARRDGIRRARGKAMETAGDLFKGFLIFAAISYPIVGIGGCMVRLADKAKVDANINYPMHSFTNEALYVPLFIIGIGILLAGIQTIVAQVKYRE